MGWPDLSLRPYEDRKIEYLDRSLFHSMVTKVFNNGEQTVNNQSTVVRTGYAYLGPGECDFMSPFVPEDCPGKHPCR